MEGIISPNNSEQIRKHLAPGIKPILPHVGNLDDFGGGGTTTFYNYGVASSESGDVDHINYNSTLETAEEKGFLHGTESGHYYISAINERDKFSENYYICTGIIVAGIHKDSGKNISFMTHQSPGGFLRIDRDKFIGDLQQRLRELKEMCKEGTIDAVIVGGKSSNADKQDYLDSVELLSTEIAKTLGFEPLVINGPQTSLDDAFYNNKQREVYFRRSKLNRQARDFTQSTIGEHIKDWE